MRVVTTSISSLMVALIAVTSAQPSNSPSMSPTSVPAAVPTNAGCVPTDFTRKDDEFTMINGILTIIEDSGMFKKSMVDFDPFEIKDKELNPVPFSALGIDFELIPTITSMVSTGLKETNPDKFEVIGSNMLNLGVSIPTELTAKATMSFHITQLEKAWWKPCWTDLFHPKRCKPMTIGVDMNAAFRNLVFDANAQVDMFACGSQSTKDCKDVTVTELAVMALNNQTQLASAKVLKRMKSIEVKDMTVSFDEMTDFGFTIHGSGEFLDEIGNKILDLSQSKVNKKKFLYKAIIGHLNKFMKNLANKQIQEKMQPFYGNTCYDA